MRRTVETEWDIPRQMRDDPNQLDFPRRWLVPLFAGAALYAAYRVIQTALFGTIAADPPIPPQARVVVSLADGVLMALSAPIAWWASRRYPIGPPRWIGNIVLHVVVALIVAVVWIAALLAVFDVATGGRSSSPMLSIYLGWLTSNLFAYFLLVAVLHALAFQHRLRARDVHAARLQTLLTAARLETLQAQLHPHFLFNTLNTISELIHIDPAAADRMVVRLAQLLRVSLEFAAKTEVPLSREIELVSAYLELQRMRHGERLAVDVNVSAGVTGALVPPMILQPLVENSLRHGIARRASGGTIWVSARATGALLRLSVDDDGVGLPAGMTEGVGLANTRGRLAELFGDAQRFDVKPRAGGGVSAVIEIPLRTN